MKLQKKLTRLFLRMRPAGQCTCERSVTENKPVAGDACPCGQRPSGKVISSRVALLIVANEWQESCTCEKAEKIDAAVRQELETDFTTAR